MVLSQWRIFPCPQFAFLSFSSSSSIRFPSEPPKGGKGTRVVEFLGVAASTHSLPLLLVVQVRGRERCLSAEISMHTVFRCCGWFRPAGAKGVCKAAAEKDS